MLSDALVMPRMMSSNCAVSPPSVGDRVVGLGEFEAVDELPGQVVGVALLVDPHLLEHLAHDQLDVLVVDVHALGLVDLLDLLDEVHLGLGAPADGQQLVRIHRALVELLAGFDLLAASETNSRVRLGKAWRCSSPESSVITTVSALSVSSIDTDAVLLGDFRQALRTARLEQLDHARQAVRDVRAGDAAGVERTHGQLRAGLADRLRGDDADRVADLGERAGGHRAAVAGLAHAAGRLALEHRAHRHGHLDALLVVVGERLTMSSSSPGRFRCPARRACARAWW